MIKSRIAAGALLLAVAGAAHAGEFSVTPTITNDYDFRGLSMTDEGPAFQLVPTMPSTAASTSARGAATSTRPATTRASKWTTSVATPVRRTRSAMTWA